MPGSSAEWSEKNGGGGDPVQQSHVREHDLLLPITDIDRVLKKGLPDNAEISQDAKDTIQEILSWFIAFVSRAANQKCLSDKRKIVDGDDLLWGISSLGFVDYVDPLEVYLAKYREFESDARSPWTDEDGSERDITPKTPDQNPQL